MKVKIIKYCDKIIEVCLYLLIFCLPFIKAAIEIFAYIAIAFWIVKRLLLNSIDKKNGLIPVTELNQALAIFLIINAVTVVLSIDHALSLRAFFGKILKFVTLYYVALDTINNKKRLKNIIIAMVLSAGLIVADASAQYFTGKDFLRGFTFERLRASFTNANGFAGWLIIFIPVFIGLLMTNFRRGKILLGGLVILLFISLLLTYTRGAWLGFVLGLGLMCYWFSRSLSRKSKVLVYTLIIICSVGIVSILSKGVKERAKSINKIEGSGLFRVNLWKEALSIVEDFPVLGTGLNTYSIVARNYKSVEGGGIYPHNSYLQMAAETGILGLASFLWILFVFFRTGFKFLNNKKNPLLIGLIAGILAFLIQAFFDTHLYSLQLVVLFWFMMGLTMAVIRLPAG